MGRIMTMLAFTLTVVAVSTATVPKSAMGRQQALKMDNSDTSGAVISNLKKDAENQKRIKAVKELSDQTSAQSMSPHLSYHSTRGEEAEDTHRGGRSKAKVQRSIHGVLTLPPDEATPFFDTYVLKYAFPTIALICSCLACILFRTMRMYQKERWKGTSYFHGARRSAESLLPGLK